MIPTELVVFEPRGIGFPHLLDVGVGEFECSDRTWSIVRRQRRRIRNGSEQLSGFAQEIFSFRRF